MDQDQAYEQAFQIIAYAGDAKSDALLSLRAAGRGDMEEARRLLQSAESKMRMAHDVQLDWMKAEATGGQVPMSIVSIHAQDHLTMAIVVHDMVAEMLLILENTQKNEEEKK